MNVDDVVELLNNLELEAVTDNERVVVYVFKDSDYRIIIDKHEGAFYVDKDIVQDLIALDTDEKVQKINGALGCMDLRYRIKKMGRTLSVGVDPEEGTLFIRNDSVTMVVSNAGDLYIVEGEEDPKFYGRYGEKVYSILKEELLRQSSVETDPVQQGV